MCTSKFEQAHRIKLIQSRDVVYTFMTQNPQQHLIYSKQRNKAFIAVLHLKVTVRPSTWSKHSHLTASSRWSLAHSLDTKYLYSCINNNYLFSNRLTFIQITDFMKTQNSDSGAQTSYELLVIKLVQNGKKCHFMVLQI